TLARGKRPRGPPLGRQTPSVHAAFVRAAGPGARRVAHQRLVVSAHGVSCHPRPVHGRVFHLPGNVCGDRLPRPAAPGREPMNHPRVHHRLEADLEIERDVCVIGSGAGGAVIAAGLARKGLSVVLLEEGAYRTRSEFRMDEGEAYRTLYQDRGLRSTSDLAITILQGKAVGGSTVINWTTCFRVPDGVLAHWAREFGVRGWTPEALAPHFEAVEQRLSIAEWPEALANANNRVLLDGCRRLGYSVGPLRRNVRRCANTGYCGMGCPVDAKQAMHLTYVPDAIESGAELFACVRAQRIEMAQGRARSVLGLAVDPESGRPTGRQIRVRARALVLSAGALNTPALLLRS